MAYEDLTKHQERVYKEILAYIKKHNKSPTRKEIALSLGYSKANAIRTTVYRLERQGYILAPFGVKRGITLTNKGLQS